MARDDKCKGCTRESRPCQYRGRASARRSCSHYEARGLKTKKQENRDVYSEYLSSLRKRNK